VWPESFSFFEANAPLKAFIIYHRTHYPAWSPLELVKRANTYAEEYLLRSESNLTEGRTGGRVSMREPEVIAWKLQPAVEAGALLVDRSH
jgi:hypothetical protein